jgi:hypothetical protein
MILERAGFFCGLLMLLLAAPGAAQQVPPAQYTLTVTPAELVILARAMDALPFEGDVIPLIVKLQAQIDAQDGNNK